MNMSTIQESIQLWTNEPAKAQVKPTVKASSDGAQGVFESGPFSWRCDLPPTLGGTNAAPSPTAYLLSALAGCAVVFIQDTLAPQLGVTVESVSAVARCEADFRGAVGMDGAISDLQNIEINIIVQSPDSESQVQKLYEAWQQRCPIYLVLTKGMPVKTSFETKSV